MDKFFAAQTKTKTNEDGSASEKPADRTTLAKHSPKSPKGVVLGKDGKPYITLPSNLQAIVPFNTSQLPNMHLLRRLDRHDAHLPFDLLPNPTHDLHHPTPSPRLPSRRRLARPPDLDPPAYYLRHLPSLRLLPAAVRHALLPIPVLEDLSVLGLRRGFPAVDEQAGERAEGGGKGRAREMDV